MRTDRDAAGWVERLFPLVPAGLAIVFWVGFAATIVNPIVISDEVVFFLTGLAGPHLQTAREMHAAVQASGAFLYPTLIHAAAAFGPPTALTKASDILLFVGAATLLAWLGRSLVDGGRSRALSAWLPFAPIGTYAAYIMPECLYFALFALAVAALAGGRQAKPGPWARGAIAGGLLALLTLAKPHGAVALIALELALAVWALLRPGRRATLSMAAAAVLGYAVVLLGVGRAITPPGLAHAGDLLGPDYRAQLAYVSSGVGHALHAVALSGLYLVAVGALWTPTLVVLALRVRSRPKAGEGDDFDRARLAGLFVLTLVALLLVAVPLVVASEADRIHLRYLNFALPVALSLAARLSPGGRRDLSPMEGRIVGLAWAAAGLAMTLALVGYRPLPADAPELFFLYGGREFGVFGLGPFVRPVFLGVVLAGAGAVASGRLGWLHAQLGVLAVFAVVSVFNVWSVCRVWQAANAADRALGVKAAALCGSGPQDVVALASTANFVPLYPPLYALRRPAPLMLLGPGEVKAALEAVPSERCVLTTQKDTPQRWLPVAASPAVGLYRVP